MDYVIVYDSTTGLSQAQKVLADVPSADAVPFSLPSGKLDAGWIEAGFILSQVYNCPNGVSVRDAVYVNGINTIDQADANGSGTYPAIGFVQSKPSATQAIVQFDGEIGGFAGLNAGDTYYLSETAGGITNVAPSGGSAVQPLGIARNTTTLGINVGEHELS